MRSMEGYIGFWFLQMFSIAGLKASRLRKARSHMTIGMTTGLQTYSICKLSGRSLADSDCISMVLTARVNFTKYYYYYYLFNDYYLLFIIYLFLYYLFIYHLFIIYYLFNIYLLFIISFFLYLLFIYLLFIYLLFIIYLLLFIYYLLLVN